MDQPDIGLYRNQKAADKLEAPFRCDFDFFEFYSPSAPSEMLCLDIMMRTR